MTGIRNVKTALLVAATLAGACAWPGEIRIDEFALSTGEVARGKPFEIGVKTSSRDVDIVSYVVRTLKPAPESESPPGFTYYNATRRLAYVEEEGQVHLRDNGARDLDPAADAFLIALSTGHWPQGRCDLAVFAHNRPGPGAHVVDQWNFSVIVAGDQVKIVDMGRPSPTEFEHCALDPSNVRGGWKSEIEPGQPLRLDVAAATPGALNVEARVPYYARRDQAPSGFTYDEEGRVAFVGDPGTRTLADNGPRDVNQDAGVIAIDFDTRDWVPGPHFLGVKLKSEASGVPVQRNLAIQVNAADDPFHVSVSAPWKLCDGTHAERMARLADGTLLYTSYLSVDRGETWRTRESGTIGCGCQELRDGSVIGMDYRTLPIDGRAGWYRGGLQISADKGRTVERAEALFHVPRAKAAQGHAYHPGPLFMRSIVERDDGVLIALMAGWFVGDDTPCPHNPQRPYSRTYACESSDRGKTWEYLSTIGYGFIGSEGYNEGSMKRLANGDLAVVLRTGSMKDARCQDNPIMFSRSADGGKTWSKPRRTGAHGAFPDLLALSDGVLALSYGRPGAAVMFSVDEGETWCNRTVVDATPYSGYTTITETAVGEILIAFGTKDYIDPESGDRDTAVRLARVRYARKDGRPLTKP